MQRISCGWNEKFGGKQEVKKKEGTPLTCGSPLFAGDFMLAKKGVSVKEKRRKHHDKRISNKIWQ
jgi:hypothetical protein